MNPNQTKPIKTNQFGFVFPPNLIQINLFTPLLFMAERELTFPIHNYFEILSPVGYEAGTHQFDSVSACPT